MANVDTATVYGHVSSTMTVTHTTVTQPEAKKRKKERPCHTELEGQGEQIFAIRPTIALQICI